MHYIYSRLFIHTGMSKIGSTRAPPLVRGARWSPLRAQPRKVRDPCGFTAAPAFRSQRSAAPNPDNRRRPAATRGRPPLRCPRGHRRTPRGSAASASPPQPRGPRGGRRASQRRGSRGRSLEPEAGNGNGGAVVGDPRGIEICELIY